MFMFLAVIPSRASAIALTYIEDIQSELSGTNQL